MTAKPTYSVDLIDNMLVRQKDRLIEKIDSATTTEQINAIAETLLTLQELWLALNYEYKYKELRERLLLKFEAIIKRDNRQNKCKLTQTETKLELR